MVMMRLQEEFHERFFTTHLACSNTCITITPNTSRGIRSLKGRVVVAQGTDVCAFPKGSRLPLCLGSFFHGVRPPSGSFLIGRANLGAEMKSEQLVRESHAARVIASEFQFTSLLMVQRG